MARGPSKVLTPKQQTYVDARMVGKSKNAAAIEAGYPHAQALEKSALVKQEIEKARTQIADLTLLKRLDVIEGIMDSIACARMQGDANAMRLGWVEIGKILGHYAPEVKKIILTDDQQRLRSKFEALSDEDLLAIQEGNVIDGEARVVN